MCKADYSASQNQWVASLQHNVTMFALLCCELGRTPHLDSSKQQTNDQLFQHTGEIKEWQVINLFAANFIAEEYSIPRTWNITNDNTKYPRLHLIIIL